MHRARFVDPTGAVRRGRWEGDQVTFADRRYAVDEVDLLAPAEPTKVVCVGLNYRDHIEEGDRETPDRPSLFLKPPNAVAGPGDVIELPRGKDRVEHECELGVVVGEQCRNVAAEDAMSVVAGYTCVNDVSNRDDQRSERNWVRGKAFDGAAPIGPVVASLDRVPDDATIETRVNGETRQRSSIDELLFDVPTLVEEITRYMTLEPGDVISTGTTSGVAPLEDGDEVEIEIEGVGTLANPVRREP
ncbi:2-hydroxyhepta-2,4-diene-1,7-dioate isomerase [Thermoplasmatales archaeon SW_10_69_26]|nr:MAG: 2-hydroxyhepta-2,4-diene-1,7-dioate isomerase [Thermoplasmatales archaeon SW_10_69_26]